MAVSRRGSGPKVQPEHFDAHRADKVRQLISIYGVHGLAALVGVSPSQPVRWRQGREGLSEPATRQLLGLEYLTSRLAEVFTARQAQAWLSSPNPYLAGSTPAQVFAQLGAAAVEPAISAVEIGAAV
ncbi:MAG: antitoxin Xre/MbcA/ParS toxin-binding domain-containing protein [Candidatus Dormibacteraceae bacterium]